MLSYGVNPDGEVLVYYYWNVHREQLTNQNNCFQTAHQLPPQAEDEEEKERARREQLKNQNYCFQTAPQLPPQAEDEEEKERVRREKLKNQNYCFQAAPQQPPQAEDEEEKERSEEGRRGGRALRLSEPA